MTRGLRRLGCALVASAGLLIGGGAALAKAPTPPEDLSAVAQYRETIPTSGGARLIGEGPAAGRPLAAQVRKQIQRDGGRDAPLLDALASSPGLGAPLRPLPQVGSKSAGLDDVLLSGRVLGLLIMMGAIASVGALRAKMTRGARRG